MSTTVDLGQVRPDIAQTDGQSTTKVMSQKAVTDALADKLTKDTDGTATEVYAHTGAQQTMLTVSQTGEIGTIPQSNSMGQITAYGGINPMPGKVLTTADVSDTVGSSAVTDCVPTVEAVQEGLADKLDKLTETTGTYLYACTDGTDGGCAASATPTAGAVPLYNADKRLRSTPQTGSYASDVLTVADMPQTLSVSVPSGDTPAPWSVFANCKPTSTLTVVFSKSAAEGDCYNIGVAELHPLPDYYVAQQSSSYFFEGGWFVGTARLQQEWGDLSRYTPMAARISCQTGATSDPYFGSLVVFENEYDTTGTECAVLWASLTI